LAETGIAYGNADGVPWIVPPEPFPLSESERASLERIGDDSARFLEAVHAAIVEDDAVGRRIAAVLHVNGAGGDFARLDAGYGRGVPLVRPDAFWDEDGRLTVVEIETMIGGLGMCEAMRAAYGRSVFPGTAEGYVRMLRPLVAGWAETTGIPAPEQPVVTAVVPESKSGYDADFSVFARALEPHGIRLLLARPERLSLADGSVRLDGERVDVIHRFFRLRELSAGSAEFALLMRVTRERLACMVQPWKEALEEKALFAFFHDRSLRGYWTDRLGVDAFARLSEALPPTWLVCPDNDALVGGLMSSERKGRPYWLKKSGNSWGGREAVDGAETTTAKWREALAMAREGFDGGDAWVLQERRVCRPHAFSLVDGDAVVTKEMNLRVSPFCFLGDGGMRLADVFVTGRRSTKVHGARDAVMVPARVV
jgi:hypothetical protein